MPSVSALSKTQNTQQETIRNSREKELKNTTEPLKKVLGTVRAADKSYQRKTYFSFVIDELLTLSSLARAWMPEGSLSHGDWPSLSRERTPNFVSARFSEVSEVDRRAGDSASAPFASRTFPDKSTNVIELLMWSASARIFAPSAFR